MISQAHTGGCPGGSGTSQSSKVCAAWCVLQGTSGDPANCKPTTNQASPRPWKVDARGLGTPWNIDDAEGNPVALTAQRANKGRADAVRAANTALIVEAVNAHDGLVALVEELENEAKTLRDSAIFVRPSGLADVAATKEEIAVRIRVLLKWC